MNISEIGLLMISAVSWLAAACFRYATISHSSLSNFEINRRAKAGDRASVELQQREKIKPRLQAIKYILTVIFLGVALVATISLWGQYIGSSVSLILLVVAPALVKLKPFRRMLQRAWKMCEPKLLDLIAQWGWLDWFSYESNRPEKRVASKEELVQIIGRSHMAVDREQITRLQSVLNFSQLSVADAMTSIKKVKTVDYDETLGPLVLDELHRAKQHHFPVVDRTTDDIVGILNLDKNIELAATKNTVKEAMDSVVYFIDQGRDLESALQGFLQTARHLFIVVDEQNKTVGVLSLRNVVGALLGQDITANSDQLRLVERKSK